LPFFSPTNKIPTALAIVIGLVSQKAFTEGWRRLKDFDAFAFGLFGSQIWKVLERSRNDRILSEVQEATS
jgi:hypothetical protein